MQCLQAESASAARGERREAVELRQRMHCELASAACDDCAVEMREAVDLLCRSLGLGLGLKAVDLLKSHTVAR